MSEIAVVADPTPAAEAPVMDVSRGPLVDITPEQRAEFRKTGELPGTPKKSEEAATSSDAKPEGEAKPVGESETPESKQELPKAKPKQTAEERIAQLEATIEKIRKGAGKETPKAEPSPAKPEPKPVQQADKEPAPEDQNADGTPKYKTYEEFTKAQARWEVRQELADQRRAEQQEAQAKELNVKVEEAKARYDNFAEVVGPAVDAIVGNAKVSPVVKQMLNDSDVFADLVYTIGSDSAEFAKFVKMAEDDPGKAIRYIALTESLIADELEGKKAKPAEEAPAKPKTQAPKPPSEAGGRAAAPPDGLESAAKAGDFRSFKSEANRRYLAKLKG
jgi:molecular chaperone GrpE (heat shock protein)